jgi:2OG-Fe(II) oxygenase superfamily
MNKEWRTEWGGAIEIHSNPRKPFENQIQSYDPLFNRAVMFETNEYSWHGFPKINLPEDRRHLSRKSISIYLYTKERPAEEIAPMHGTFYVQRPLPARFTAGYTLSEEDAAELTRLLIRRDGWIELYQKMELDKNRYIAALEGAARAPLTGYGVQDGPATGLYADGWAAPRLRLRIRPLLPVSGIVLRGWRGNAPPQGRVRLSVEGTEIFRLETKTEQFDLAASLPKTLDQPFSVEIAADFESKLAPPGDVRDLAFLLTELRLRHPGLKDSAGLLRRIFASMS